MLEYQIPQLLFVIQKNCVAIAELFGEKKRGCAKNRTSSFYVDLPGFEPRLTEPKSVVLPLHHRSILYNLGVQIYCFF